MARHFRRDASGNWREGGRWVSEKTVARFRRIPPHRLEPAARRRRVEAARRAQETRFGIDWRPEKGREDFPFNLNRFYGEEIPEKFRGKTHIKVELKFDTYDEAGKRTRESRIVEFDTSGDPKDFYYDMHRAIRENLEGMRQDCGGISIKVMRVFTGPFEPKKKEPKKRFTTQEFFATMPYPIGML